MTTTTLTKRSDPLDSALARVDAKYHYQARRFVEFLRDNGLRLGDPGAWHKYLGALKDYSASTFNNYLSAAKATIRVALDSDLTIKAETRRRSSWSWRA